MFALCLLIENQLERLRLRKLLDYSALAYWASLGLTGPYLALLSFTRLYQALLGLTGPYWALLVLR